MSNWPVQRQFEFIVTHINLVRSLPGLLHSRVVFCPESNLGAEGVRITEDLRRSRVQNTYVLREHSGQEGFQTDERAKKKMWISVNAALDEHRIRFHPHMICANTIQGHTPASMRALVVAELKNYKRRLVYNNNDPHKLPKELFTGKIGGAKDDHAIVTQLLYVSREIYRQKWAFYRSQPPIYTAGEEYAQIHLRQNETIAQGSSMY